jgi:Flp pilus assembly pilin Flp
MLNRLYVRFTEGKGQTMAEYALIMAAVAILCIAAYQALGGGITGLVTTVDGYL